MLRAISFMRFYGLPQSRSPLKFRNIRRTIIYKCHENFAKSWIPTCVIKTRGSLSRDISHEICVTPRYSPVDFVGSVNSLNDNRTRVKMKDRNHERGYVNSLPSRKVFPFISFMCCEKTLWHNFAYYYATVDRIS